MTTRTIFALWSFLHTRREIVYIQWIIQISKMTLNILKAKHDFWIKSGLAYLGIKLNLWKHQPYSIEIFSKSKLLLLCCNMVSKNTCCTMNEEFCHKVWKSLSFLRRDRTLIYTISIHKVRANFASLFGKNGGNHIQL